MFEDLRVAVGQVIVDEAMGLLEISLKEAMVEN